MSEYTFPNFLIPFGRSLIQMIRFLYSDNNYQLEEILLLGIYSVSELKYKYVQCRI